MNRPILISPHRAYLLICIPLLVIVSWSVLTHPLYTANDCYDSWEHSATIREWSKNLWHPRNPHLALDTGTPRYMPYFFLLTLLAIAFGLDPLQALGVGGILTMILLLCGVRLFLLHYFKNDWAPFVGLNVLLAGWGIGWLWSNVYQLRSLLYVIVYPSSFVFGLAFFSLWLAKQTSNTRTATPWNWAALCLISGLMCLSHPLTGVFAIGSVCLLALLEPKVPFRIRCKIIVAVLIGALAAELWPYFSVWRVILGISGAQADSWLSAGQMDTGRAVELCNVHAFYDPMKVFVTLGPSISGVPALFYLAYRKEHLFIVVGFVVMILPYTANLVFPVPLGHRFLLFAIFYLHLALIWSVLKGIVILRSQIQQKAFTWSARIMTAILISLLTAFIVWNGALAALELAGYSMRQTFRFRTGMRPVLENMRLLSTFIPDEAIVMAPARLSWPLPTFSGKIVALYHINPMVVDHSLRRTDTIRFFSVNTPQSERLNILQRYKVTHILYSKSGTPEAMKSKVNAFGAIVATIGDYVIIKRG